MLIATLISCGDNKVDNANNKLAETELLEDTSIIKESIPEETFSISYSYSNGYSYYDRITYSVTIVDSVLKLTFYCPKNDDWNEVDYSHEKILSKKELATIKQKVIDANIKQIKKGFPQPLGSGYTANYLTLTLDTVRVEGGTSCIGVFSEELTDEEINIQILKETKESATISGNYEEVFVLMESLFTNLSELYHETSLTEDTVEIGPEKVSYISDVKEDNFKVIFWDYNIFEQYETVLSLNYIQNNGDEILDFNYPKFDSKLIDTNLLELSNNDVKIYIETKPFVKDSHDIVYIDEVNMIMSTIDGMELMGHQDEGIPTTEISSMYILNDGNRIDIDKKYYVDLYKADIYSSTRGKFAISAFYKEKNKIIISMFNGNPEYAHLNVLFFFNQNFEIDKRIIF